MIIKLPEARTADILEQEAGDELMIYDLQTDRAYSLNETSKIVYIACSRRTAVDELKRRHKFTDDLIYLTLDELKQKNLLAGDYVSPFAGLTRREAVRRVGLACAAALPVIAAVVAPQASQAASGPTACARRGGTCVPGGQNICTGVVGQRFDLYYYSPSNAGACRGADSGVVTPNFTCTNDPNNTSFLDVCRVPR